MSKEVKEILDRQERLGGAARRGRGGGCSECGRREKRRRTDPRGARVTPRRWTSNPQTPNAGPAPPGPRKTYVVA